MRHTICWCHYRLPDAVSDEEGAIIEPLAVAVHACRKAKVEVGSTVLICGAGPIGLLCLLSAKAMGATNILVTGKVSQGCNHFLNPLNATNIIWGYRVCILFYPFLPLSFPSFHLYLFSQNLPPFLLSFFFLFLPLYLFLATYIEDCKD